MPYVNVKVSQIQECLEMHCGHLKYVFIFATLGIILFHISTQGSQKKIFKYHNETFVPPIKIQSEGLPWPTSIDPHVKPLKDGVAKPAKIIMLGYLRGGTTFIGQVLGVRAGTFYLYEPLFELGSFVYFKTGEMCGMTQNSCGVSLGYKKVLQIIDAVFNCNFDQIKDKIRPWQFSRGKGLLENETPTECRKISYDKCLFLQAKRCRSADAIVIKIARTDVAVLEKMLHKQPNIKIVHLIRDPRAIAYSQYLAWPVHFRNTIEHGRAICGKVVADAMEGRRLNRKYPGTLYTAYYEDITADPLNQIQKLYDFVGYEFNGNDIVRIHAMTSSNSTPRLSRYQKKWNIIKTNSTEVAFRWRNSMSVGLLRLLNVVCRDVYGAFGYPHLKTQKDLKNTSIPLRFRTI